MTGRNCCHRLRAFLVAAALGVTLALTPGAGADATEEIKNWKELLPEAEFAKLVGESAKLIQDSSRSATSLNQSSKKIQNECYTLIVLAEVARQGSEGEAKMRALALQHAAAALADAAKKKNLDDVKKLAAEIADFKKAAPPADLKPLGSLSEKVPVHNLMEAVQSCYKKHQEFGRMSSAAFGQKGKAEELATAAYKMAAFSVAITAHLPKDKDELKGKQPDDWLKPTADMRKATLEIAAAAKAKKHNDAKAAIRRMDAACTKCHDNFRIDTDK